MPRLLCRTSSSLFAALVFTASAAASTTQSSTFCDDGRAESLRKLQRVLDAALEQGLGELQKHVEAHATPAAELLAPVKVRGGVVSLVLPDGRCISSASGMADAERGIPMTIQHRFVAGSTPKTMVAALVIGEVLEGTLRLDDPIARFLGGQWWFGYLVNGAEITVRQLLAHTAGLTNLQWGLYARSPDFRGAFVVKEPDYPSVLARAGYFLLPAEHAPGEKHQYSDAHYVFLALLLEQLNGERFELQVHRMLYRLGMMFSEPDAMAAVSGIAKGYLGDSGGFASPGIEGAIPSITDDGVFKILLWNAHGGGWLISSPRDLARWAWIYFGGRLYEDEYVKTLIEAGHPRGKEEDNWYGLGVDVWERSRLGLRLDHGGFDWGYGTFMAYYPEHDLAVAVQINTNVPDVDFSLGEEIAVRMAAELGGLRLEPREKPPAAGASGQSD